MLFDTLAAAASSIWDPSPSVDVTAVDATDMAGRQSALMERGEVTGFTSLDSMIDLALERAGDLPLGRLDVHDHGAQGNQGFGNEVLSLEKLEDPAVRESLARLAEAFGPEGALELHGCHVGGGERGDEYLRTLARDLDVPVSAGVPFQNSLPGFEGSVKTCFPPELKDDGYLYQTCETEERPRMDQALEEIYGWDLWY